MVSSKIDNHHYKILLLWSALNRGIQEHSFTFGNLVCRFGTIIFKKPITHDAMCSYT